MNPVCATSCVFIVDDDEDDQFLLQQVFRQYSPECRIKTLVNGVELLDALQTISDLPALVLLDLNMPLMSGFEALAQIRQNGAYDSLPVVILTTSSLPEDQERAEQLKATGFVTKPADMEEYSQLVLKLRRDFLIGRCVE
ncbi:response regulator [Larkinella ripae]